MVPTVRVAEDWLLAGAKPKKDPTVSKAEAVLALDVPSSGITAARFSELALVDAAPCKNSLEAADSCNAAVDVEDVPWVGTVVGTDTTRLLELCEEDVANPTTEPPTANSMDVELEEELTPKGIFVGAVRAVSAETLCDEASDRGI